MQNSLYQVSEINHQNNMLVLHLSCRKGMIPFAQGDEVVVRKEPRNVARTDDMQQLVDAAGQTMSPVEKLLREDYVREDRAWGLEEPREHWQSPVLRDKIGATVSFFSLPIPPQAGDDDQERTALTRVWNRRQANIQIITNAQRMYRVLHWLVEARRASDLSTMLFNIEVAEELLEEIRKGK